MRLLPAVGALTALATHALTGVATADTDQLPWASIGAGKNPAACTKGGTVTNQTGQATVDHPYPIARLTALSGGPGSWVAGSVGPAIGVGAGDVAWSAMDPVKAKQSPSSKMSCPDTTGTKFEFKVEFFDAPVAPATFSGRITRIDDKQWGSVLLFLAPETSLYAADVELRSGAARFCAYTPGRDFGGGLPPRVCSTVRESGTIALGAVQQGPTIVGVVAEPGTPADYVVRFRPTPPPPSPPPAVAAGTVRFAPRYVKPGSPAALRFELTGATTLSAAVRDATGRPVRGLADRQAMPAGANVLTWDGRDEAGRPVTDGRYGVGLTAEGTPEASSPTLTVDGTRPTVVVGSPATRLSPATVRVADGLSGIARAVVRSGPLPTSRTLGSYTGKGRIRVAAPRGGWKVGTKLHVMATDRAGNATTLNGRVVLPRACAAVNLRSRRLIDVIARGTSCEVARGVARAGGGVQARYVAQGFTCVRSKGPRWSCSRRAARITFRAR